METRRGKDLENLSRRSNIWILGVPELENKTVYGEKSLKK